MKIPSPFSFTVPLFDILAATVEILLVGLCLLIWLAVTLSLALFVFAAFVSVGARESLRAFLCRRPQAERRR